MLIRPQSKRAKEHRAMLAALAVGDEVVTGGGILGKVTEVGDNFITVEVADGVRLKVQKGQVSALMLKSDEGQYDPSKTLVARALRAIVPVSNQLHGQHFLTRIDGKLTATPLLVALLLVDFADVVFAVDSIPAILAVSQDPFIVFTSNAFAILGLRALYFAIAGLMEQFRYVRYSLVFILAFVGVKMILVLHYHIPNLISLAIILAALVGGVLASMLIKPSSSAPAGNAPAKDRAPD